MRCRYCKNTVSAFMKNTRMHLSNCDAIPSPIGRLLIDKTLAFDEYIQQLAVMSELRWIPSLLLRRMNPGGHQHVQPRLLEKFFFFFSTTNGFSEPIDFTDWRMLQVQYGTDSIGDGNGTFNYDWSRRSHENYSPEYE
ncbi:hypothetical protein GQ600_19330 [Phytophthora cactorum]|nr:hypothetical protein GQ600_19330 [Phytophthora cactorum]